MKKINRSLLYFLILGTSVVSSCKEESENVFTMFKDVKVTFNGENPLSVTDYKLVNDGDSVYVDYTITSGKEDIYTVVEEKVGGDASLFVRTNRVISDESDRRSYSRVIKLKMQRDGKTSYRIYALNEKGYYIGDGYTKVTIEQNPSYRVVANRRIFAPDSVEKVKPSFFSITRGESFSYTDGEQNSADIDFGVWRRKFISATGVITYAYNYYSPSAAVNPFPIYNIGAWTKRGTVFSPITQSGNNIFNYTLVSSSMIEERAKAVTLNVTSTDFASAAAGLVANSLVYFLTPEGKYGAFMVHQNTTDINGIPYLNISVKIQP